MSALLLQWPFKCVLLSWRIFRSQHHFNFWQWWAWCVISDFSQSNLVLVVFVHYIRLVSQDLRAGGQPLLKAWAPHKCNSGGLPLTKTLRLSLRRSFLFICLLPVRWLLFLKEILLIIGNISNFLSTFFNSCASVFNIASYLGNQALSYGQTLTFSLRLDRGVRRPSVSDVMLEGAGLKVSASLGDLRTVVPCGKKITYTFTWVTLY